MMSKKIAGGQDSKDALNFKRHAIILMAICQWWNAFSFFSFRAFWGSIKRQPYVWMDIAEGQHLSMRFLKSQLLCSKIKTDGGSSRNLGSASFKNENQEERLKFNYLTCSFEKDFVR